MQQDMLAPWAELVPGAAYPMTVEDVEALTDDDGWMYELVEGRLVRMPPSGGGDSSRAMSLGAAITIFVEALKLGRVTGADGEYVLSKAGELPTALAPDIAFVKAGRYPAADSPDFERFWRLAPDLVVEIVSPNQYRPAMTRKALRYLEAGVRLVWLIWPKYKRVDIWRPESAEPVATLDANGMLDGLDVLPGFRFPVSRLFG